jgi:carbon monoxide dehydrogenase subunit G
MSDLTNGCLVLADIGGYTEYLGGVELQHSHDILADLLGTVAGQLTGPLELAKLEGDAVFCFERGQVDGESLVTAIQSCYFAFAQRQRTISVATSCECDACRRIPDLTLKFLAHRGAFVEHEVAGSRELVGPDVILAHRLLKNSVTERTGLKGYAFLTDACTAELSIDSERAGLAAHAEHYEDAGDAPGWVLDLEERWRQEQEQKSVVVSRETAVIVHDVELSVPPAQVWHALTDPKAQMLWKVGADRVDMENPGGARGVGSTTHCVHGKTTIAQEIVDWKPYGYYTYREHNPMGKCLWTIELEPVGDGGRTRMSWIIALAGGAGQRVLWRLFGNRMRQAVDENLEGLVNFLNREPDSAEA